MLMLTQTSTHIVKSILKSKPYSLNNSEKYKYEENCVDPANLKAGDGG